MIHHLIHVATIVLNPTFAYSCNFDFDGKVMEGFLMCLQNMVPGQEACKIINHEMELYSNANWLFGFNTIVEEINILMSSKPLEFISLITCSIWNLNYVSWFPIYYCNEM